MASTWLQIGLFLPPTTGYFSDVLAGVQEYGRQAERWSVELCPTLQIARGALQQWQPDGILVNVDDPEWDVFLQAQKVPVVQVGGRALAGFVGVSSDHEAIGRIAAEHLLERGFRHFAFCGYPGEGWWQARERGFAAVLMKSGFSYLKYPGLDVHLRAVETEIAPWVRGLPTPIGVFGCHDRVAMLLGYGCMAAGVRVPEEVAVLGVDNNPVDCLFPTPPLSSVAGSARRVGYEAAALLDRMIKGGRAPTGVMLVAPSGVVVRQSTDTLAMNDPDLTAAIKFIRARAGEAITVEDVANGVLVSRRMLERKFQAVLKHSPRQEILRAHVEQAKNLMLQTHLELPEVARRSGFPSGSKLSSVFRREVGMTPTEFRKRYRIALGR